MTSLKVFEHSEFGSVRIVMRSGEPWFVAKDVAERLGYANPQKAVRDHCKNPCAAGVNDSFTPENKGFAGDFLDPQTTLINQSDVLRLIVRSSLPEAVRIEKWIFEDVLPAVLKHGGYLTPAKIEEALLNPDTIIQLATTLKEERARRMELEAQAAEDRPLVGFAKAVQASEDTILVRNLAGFMKQNGVDIGQNRLFEWLRANGYLCRDRGENWNRPTQKSLNLGLFEVKESISINPDGSTRLFFTSKVTGKGQLYFLRKFGVGGELESQAVL